MRVFDNTNKFCTTCGAFQWIQHGRILCYLVVFFFSIFFAFFCYCCWRFLSFSRNDEIDGITLVSLKLFCADIVVLHWLVLDMISSYVFNIHCFFIVLYAMCYVCDFRCNIEFIVLNINENRNTHIHTKEMVANEELRSIHKWQVKRSSYMVCRWWALDEHSHIYSWWKNVKLRKNDSHEVISIDLEKIQ